MDAFLSSVDALEADWKAYVKLKQEKDKKDKIAEKVPVEKEKDVPEEKPVDLADKEKKGKDEKEDEDILVLKHTRKPKQLITKV